MVQQLMVMKQASRSISRMENEKGLLAGQMISTSDLDFVIDEVRVVWLSPPRPGVYPPLRVYSRLHNRTW